MRRAAFATTLAALAMWGASAQASDAEAPAMSTADQIDAVCAAVGVLPLFASPP